ncbi:MAG: hypothetical protein JO250_11420 [Armatimonadetes bacterium]|nr:hypothetical protein [Armatimonadota bacterium]
MTSTFRPLLIGLTVALGVTAAHADSAAAARRAIQADYSGSNAAATRRDAAGTLARFTPDAVSVDTKGHATPIAQQQQTVTRLFAAARSVTARTTIQTFSLDRPTQATVTVREHTALALVNPQTQQPVRLVVDDTARDLWIKTAQGWREKRSQDLTYNSTLNGQPLPVP